MPFFMVRVKLLREVLNDSELGPQFEEAFLNHNIDTCQKIVESYCKKHGLSIRILET